MNPAADKAPKPEFGSSKAGFEGRSTSDLEADIKQLREDIAKLTEQLATTGGSAKRAAVDGVAELKAQGQAAVDQAKAQAREFEEQLTDKVREKPLSALAIAAAVGYFFALLSRR